MRSEDCPCFNLQSYCQFSGSTCPFNGTCHGTSTACSCDNCGMDLSGVVAPQCVPCTHAPSPSIVPWDGHYPFDLWYDTPSSPAYKKRKPGWWETLLTRAGENFTTVQERVQFGASSRPENVSFGRITSSARKKAIIQVNLGQHGAIHLFANPSFQQVFDNKIRALNGVAEARKWTGVNDRVRYTIFEKSKAEII